MATTQPSAETDKPRQAASFEIAISADSSKAWVARPKDGPLPPSPTHAQIESLLKSAKIQMTDCIDPDLAKCVGDDNEGSDWLGAVPEPGPLALFSTSLIVAGALMRRSRAR